MPNHEEIYRTQADVYERLISKQQSLANVIERLTPVQGLDIIDLGAGSGRLTCSLAPKANSILALDESEAMLKIAARKLTEAGLHNWRTQKADHRYLPVKDRTADMVVSGWSICYLASTTVPSWRENLHQVMTELRRVLRPGGTAIIFENYGTGSELPEPLSFLQQYFRLLEQEYGFSHQWIRTDYQFESVEEAEWLTRFFFGDAMADRVKKDRLVQLPECAGVWWLNT